MTATANSVSQAVTEWTKIFPKQITENYTSSLAFMKQLTTVAVSTITYLKSIFPEDSYSVESFSGVTLRILKKKCKNDLASFLTTAIAQAFDAFDKKYLHQLALCFYDGECKMDNLIEYHVFEYSYKPDGVTMNLHMKNRNSLKQTAKYDFNNVKERTLSMVRSCIVLMQTCQQQLPSSFDISLRLYYNDDAPEGYQAPGFLCSSDGDDHLAPTFCETTKYGSVETPFHKVVARTYMKDSIISSREAIPSQNEPQLSQTGQEEFAGVKSVSDASESAVKCPCNKTDVTTSMLTCQYCNTQQHAACFGLLSAEADALHCCDKCFDLDSTRAHTDSHLASLSAKKRECLCIFRRALELCFQMDSISGQDLMLHLAISQRTNAAKLMKLLQSHDIVGENGAGFSGKQPINVEALNAVISKFFHTNEGEQIVGRLLAETFASQQSQPDPVAEVLGPLEKVSLQKASNHGQVIENPDFNKTVIEDSTLKQYREAILSDERIDEDLPLSGSHNPVQDIQNLGKKSSNKRKIEDAAEGRPKLRSGLKTKRARILP